MKVDFTINGSFDFCFDEQRQRELIKDAKDYPGGLTCLLLNNLEEAMMDSFVRTNHPWKVNPVLFETMLKQLLIRERDENSAQEKS